MIGCGVINRAIVRYLFRVCPALRSLYVFDTVEASAERFACQWSEAIPGLKTRLARSAEEVLAACPVTSLATTAMEPHLHDAAQWYPAALVLHVSLRDISPEAILACDNVVDDIEHVCRAATSVHLAEQKVGHRGFIRCTLANVLLQRPSAAATAGQRTILSPFGLGILDLAVARLVYDWSVERGLGLMIDDFLVGPA